MRYSAIARDCLYCCVPEAIKLLNTLSGDDLVT